MVVQTMNDDERGFEAFRTLWWMNDWLKELRPLVHERFRKGDRFPYVQHFERTDDKGNTWTLLCIVPTKAHKKKGLYCTYCYTTYFIPPKHKKNDTNSGFGVLLYDPVGLLHFINHKDDDEVRMSVVADIVPHAINRYTERCLNKEGKTGYDIHKKVRNLLLRFHHFDIEPDKYGDKSSVKHKDDGIFPYDVMIRDGGILRGQIVTNMLIRFFTYISPDEMYDNQKERYDEMMREKARWKAKGR